MSIKRAVELIKEAKNIVVTAGAGMGVDSGLPDFRGDKGFWKAYPKLNHIGSFKDIANPRTFREDPQLAWAFYGHRLNMYRETKPHKGYDILRDILNLNHKKYFIYTSNVDRAFHRAGFCDFKIFECHGTIEHFQCVDNCNEGIWRPLIDKVEIDEEEFLAVDFKMPRCPDCGAIARPNVLMFSDPNWESSWYDKQEERYNDWVSRTNGDLLVIEIGCGTDIPTTRYAGEDLDCPIIRINPRDYAVDQDRHVSLPMGALEALEKIQEAM